MFLVGKETAWRKQHRAIRYLEISLSMCLGIGVASCTTSDADESALTLFAYMTANELVVMDGDDLVGKGSGHFRATVPLRWTHNGRYAVALSQDPKMDDTRNNLVIVDARSGKDLTRRCENCTSIVTIDDSQVLATTSNEVRDAALLRFDLDDQGPPVRIEPDLPESEYPELLASTRTKALMAVADSEKISIHGGPQELFAVNADGSTRALGSVGGDSAIEVATGLARGPVSTFVVDGGFTDSACLSGGVFTLIDGSSGAMTKTDTNRVMPNSTLFPAGGGSGNGSLVAHSFWWDTQGQLNASLKSWTCDPHAVDYANQQKVSQPWSHWRLVGRV